MTGAETSDENRWFREGLTSRFPSRTTAVVLLVMAFVIVLRMLMMREGPTRDEGGFLVLGGQWHSGTSLYGNYWVDRPPLLIALFGLAAHSGGLVSLQVMGAIAAAVCVVLLASTARRAFGDRAAIGTAIVGGSLLVSPLYGSLDINGELLAAPFLALGMRLAVEAALSPRPRVAWASAFGAGAAAIAALLVKQNMADVVVFAAVCWLVSWRTGKVSGRTLLQFVGLAALGAFACLATVMGLALLKGTSAVDVYQATYPFRVRAAHLAAGPGSGFGGVRFDQLIEAFLKTGVPLLLVAMLVFGFRNSRTPAVTVAVGISLLYSAGSILAGGSYWLHYLVETVPALALGAGAVVAAAPGVYTLVAAVLIASTSVAMVPEIRSPRTFSSTAVGEAIADSAHQGDTVFSAFDGGDVLSVSGLTSPYPYLWSLPARVLDGDLSQLRRLLAGPSAPTWIVIRGRTAVKRMITHGAMPMIRDRYRLAGRICGLGVYLLRGTERDPLIATSDCHAKASS